MLCAMPALRALRACNPQAKITLIGLAWASELAARFSRYIDDFLALPGFPALPESEFDGAALPDFLRAAQARRFDLVLQLHGSGPVSNVLAMLLRGRSIAGYYRSGDYRPSVDFLEWRDGEHEIRRWLRLLQSLGAPPRGESLELPLDAGDYAMLDADREARRLCDRDFVCIHPGAQLASRRWPPERFAAVGDALAALGYGIVLTGSTRERELVSRVARAMQRPAVDLAGRTSLGAVAALIDRARLLVSNDTGVSHVAAAVRTPSVVVACGSDVERWRPLDRRIHRVIHHAIECRPCAHAECPIGHPCAIQVTAERVVAEATTLLSARSAGSVARSAACAR
jgi:ADP-heptose:LPS heptosyltransferase